jgi:hypothetical protein
MCVTTALALAHGVGHDSITMADKRSRELKPLSSEHEQGRLVAFQLKNGLAGHGDSAGAPKDLAGLYSLARRFRDAVLASHTKAEEELIGRFLSEADLARLCAEHAELLRLVDAAKGAKASEMRASLYGFAELLERHVRWEEKELFPAFEARVLDTDLADVGGELERRLVIARSEAQARRRPQT